MLEIVPGEPGMAVGPDTALRPLLAQSLAHDTVEAPPEVSPAPEGVLLLADCGRPDARRSGQRAANARALASERRRDPGQ